MHREAFLMNEIETCRDEMTRVAFKNSLTSPEVLKISEKLDQLMNEYDGIAQKEYSHI